MRGTAVNYSNRFACLTELWHCVVVLLLLSIPSPGCFMYLQKESWGCFWLLAERSFLHHCVTAVGCRYNTQCPWFHSFTLPWKRCLGRFSRMKDKGVLYFLSNIWYLIKHIYIFVSHIYYIYIIYIVAFYKDQFPKRRNLSPF